MPYTELIKNFNRTGDCMREFYVYGFKSREEYDKKSARSYDGESTVRRKLKEYEREGIAAAEKHGKTVYCRRAESGGDQRQGKEDKRETCKRRHIKNILKEKHIKRQTKGPPQTQGKHKLWLH